MKLHRSLAVAAVTAFVSSAVLVAAPAAMAVDSPPPAAPAAASATPDYSLTSAGVPKEIKAGDAPTPFSITLKNTGKQDITFQPGVSLWDALDTANSPLKASHYKLEAYDAKADKWSPVKVDFDNPGRFGDQTITPGNSYTYKLRLSAAKDAPARTLVGRIAFSTMSNEQVKHPENPGVGFEVAIKSASGETPAPVPSKETKPTTPAGNGQAEVVTNPNKGSGAELKFTGFPGKVVAGAAPAEFSLNIANTTGKDGEFGAVFSLMNKAGTLKASHIQLEAFQNGAWQKVRLTDDDGEVFGALGDWTVEPSGEIIFNDLIQLGAGKSADVKLRIAMTKEAPQGDAVGMSGSAIFLNDEAETNKVAYSDFYVFYIDNPAGTKPKPSEKPTPGNKGKNGKAGAQLAETGAGDSNNTAMTVGIVGGVALVGGAGVLVALRRRGSNGGAAA